MHQKRDSSKAHFILRRLNEVHGHEWMNEWKQRHKAVQNMKLMR